MNITPVRRANTARDPCLVDTAVDYMNISSSSEEGFKVEPFSLPKIEDRFRVPPSSITNMPAAFKELAEASLLVNNKFQDRSRGCIDTRGTFIESQLMDIFSDIPDISSTIFIDTSNEKMNPFPTRMCKDMHIAALRRVYVQCLDNNKKQDIMLNHHKYPAKQVPLLHIKPHSKGRLTQVYQVPYLPKPVPFYPNGRNDVGYGTLGHNIQLPSSNNASTHYGPLLQMNHPVMPEVAGYCPDCSKTYNQIAVETITNYVTWSKYPEETIRDRNIRSREFVDELRAALICFINAGLSPGFPSEMSGEQHRRSTQPAPSCRMKPEDTALVIASVTDFKTFKLFHKRRYLFSNNCSCCYF